MMHWYDWALFAICWAMIPACLGMRAYHDWKWQRKFGERRPR